MSGVRLGNMPQAEVLERLRMAPRNAEELAQTVAIEIEKYLTPLARMQERAASQIAESEDLVTDIYHLIEFENFNACRGYYLAKQLQDTLRARRQAKDEISKLAVIKEAMNILKPLNDHKSMLGQRHYNFRTQKGRLLIFRGKSNGSEGRPGVWK